MQLKEGDFEQWGVSLLKFIMISLLLKRSKQESISLSKEVGRGFRFIESRHWWTLYKMFAKELRNIKLVLPLSLSLPSFSLLLFFSFVNV